MRGPEYEPLTDTEEPELPLYSQNTSNPGTANRPPVYYNEGPFSPPSSDDGIEDLEKEYVAINGSNRFDDDEDEEQLVVGGKRRQHRPAALRRLLFWLLGLLLVAATIGALAARSYNGTSFKRKGRKHIELDHIFNGTFSAESQSLHWVPEAGDGVFSASDHTGDIHLVDLKSNSSQVLVKKSAVKDEHGKELSWAEWKLSPDMKYLLLKADRVKQWRHSSYGNYYVHNLETGATHPLVQPSDPPLTAYATWSPTGQSIAYVLENDLYVKPNPTSKAIRVTTGGNSSIFHGVPDWVYEEEVFSSDYALWWSPDSSHIAYLRFDETDVEEFSYPVYNPTDNSFEVVPYPDYVVMKYPKPGYNNPLVSVHIFDVEEHFAGVSEGEEEDVTQLKDRAPAPKDKSYKLSWEGQRPAKDSIIQEVAWVGNTTLIIKEINRSGDDGSVLLFDLTTKPAKKGHIVRKLGKEGEEGDNGWIEASQNVYPIPSELSGGKTAYIDILPNKEGYNHLAIFSPVDSSVPRWLTSGSWEVTGSVLGINIKRKLVYFIAAAPSAMERNLYAASIPDLSSPVASPSKPTSLTDSSQMSYYSASFSPQSGFYVLSYQGPNIPHQSVIQVGNDSFKFPLTDNKALNETSSEFQMPTIVRQTIMSDGYELNVKEVRPPGMDDSGRTKYPVLFQVYGGPGSQLVSARWERDWHHYLACSLKYIVVVVDGRGTGFKGRKLRNPVRKNLGEYEVKDQLNAARLWADKRYVDSRRIGIWGWSYGGFMSSKVVEANAGIHSLAMAVAPVTSWRLYDSIYTERYMDTPQSNPDGYVNASISNVEGFRNVDFLLAHGSGDDNVHFANSAHLLDMFTAGKIRNFRFRMFTDSDHSMGARGAYRELYEWMTTFLVERWGVGGYRRGW